MTSTPPTPAPQFRQIDLSVDRAAVLGLTVEYMRWVSEGIAAHLLATTGAAPPPWSVEDYVARKLDATYGKKPPDGVFYLVEHGGTLAGLCGLRRIAPRTAEFKRIYVRPSHRGLRLGEAMLQRLIGHARAFGCDTAVLDSAPFMHAAHRLYAAAGFTDCAPYAGSEAPVALMGVWRFMARGL
ncbi:MAG: GNAT family N-acetyltransferase [Vitreoscilla sp.]|nr:GNAT family N-acetyltransferase [Vitreoscilla sp.]